MLNSPPLDVVMNSSSSRQSKQHPGGKSSTAVGKHSGSNSRRRRGRRGGGTLPRKVADAIIVAIVIVTTLRGGCGDERRLFAPQPPPGSNLIDLLADASMASAGAGKMPNMVSDGVTRATIDAMRRVGGNAASDGRGVSSGGRPAAPADTTSRTSSKDRRTDMRYR